MTERLTDMVGQVEEAVLDAAAHAPGAPGRLAQLRMLVSMQLEAGALAGDEVDDDEATQLRYLATMLAHLRQHELGIRLLRDGACRAPARTTRARLGALHGVLLAQLGRTAEARTRLEEALADAAGEAAESARIHSALAALTADESALRLLDNAETLDPPTASTAFAHAFARLQLALLRENRDDATRFGAALAHAGDAVISGLPDTHPAALAAVADLAYAQFRTARLCGTADRPTATLRAATLALTAALGAENPRTITARFRQAECDQLSGGSRFSDVRAETSRLFGSDHPLTVAATAAVAAAESSYAGSSSQVRQFSPEPIPATPDPSAPGRPATGRTAGRSAANPSVPSRPGTARPGAALPGAGRSGAGLAPAGSSSAVNSVTIPSEPGAEVAARVLGRHHPLTVVLTAAARPEGDALAQAAAQAALVLGVGHSVTRMLDKRLRSCRRTGPNTTPTHRTTDAIGTDTTAMSEPTAAATAATATASTHTDADLISTSGGGAAPPDASGAAVPEGAAASPDNTADTGPESPATAGDSATPAEGSAAAQAAPTGGGEPAIGTTPGNADLPVAAAPGNDDPVADAAPGNHNSAADAAPGNDGSAVEAAPVVESAAGVDSAAGATPTAASADAGSTAEAAPVAVSAEDAGTAADATPAAASPAAASPAAASAADSESGADATPAAASAAGGEPGAVASASAAEAGAADTAGAVADGGPDAGAVPAEGAAVAATGSQAAPGDGTSPGTPGDGTAAPAAPTPGGSPGRGRGPRPAESEEKARVWDAIEKIKDDGGVIRGKVVEVVKGGLVLDVGVRAFLPASLVEMRRVRDLNPYVGRELEARVLEMDRGRGNLVLSRRAHLEETRSAGRSTLLEQLQAGQIRRGVISSVVNFGAFVDLGGVDGLISVAELSWTHHNHPSDVVEVGQEVEVEVLDVDQARGRISLSLKATQQDPWPQFARNHPIGQIVSGRVTKLMPFGAFIRVDGLEGLVHVSELADHRVDTPDQVLRAGQDVLAKVTDIDLQRRRISLSIRQANAEYLPEEEQFDPVTYGMLNTYDAQGNYIYPEGFDADTGEWLPGFEEQRDAWERQYADARDRWVALGQQVAAAQSGAPAYTAGPPSGPRGGGGGGRRGGGNDRSSSHGSGHSNSPRTAAEPTTGNEDIDERLAALRERLSDGRNNED